MVSHSAGKENLKTNTRIRSRAKPLDLRKMKTVRGLANLFAAEVVESSWLVYRPHNSSSKFQRL